MSGPCCDAGEHAALSALAGELEAEAAGDPTLEGCCRRDLEDQAAAARLRAALSLTDPSRARQRLARQVIGAPPPAASAGSSDLGSGDEEEEDGGGVLERLRAARLAELRAAAAAKARLQAEGRGAVATVPEGRLLDAVERSGAAAAVCHLAVGGSEACDVLDEHLALLAHRYRGTAFMRTPLTHGSSIHARLGTPPGPGLACFREGAFVGVLDCYGGEGGGMAEEEVDSHLRALRMLRSDEDSRAGGAASGAAAASSDEEGEDGGGSGAGAAGGWCDPCEVCGRRYPHQHMRTMYARGEDGADSDGGSSSG